RVRGYLGAELQVMDKSARSYYKLGEDQPGLLLAFPYSGGAAAEAGLRSGDVLIQFGDLPLPSGSTEKAEGQIESLGQSKIKVDILRQGELKSIDVTLKETPPCLASLISLSAFEGIVHQESASCYVHPTGNFVEVKTLNNAASSIPSL